MERKEYSESISYDFYLDSFYIKKHMNTCPKSQETARIDVATHAGAPLQYHNNIVNDGISVGISLH